MNALSRVCRRWSRFELTQACAVYETMFPRGADPRITDGAVDLDLASYLRETTAALPLSAAIALRGAFITVACAASVRLRRLAAFTHLAARERLALLERLSGSDVYVLRSTFTLIKTTGALAFARSSRLRPHGSARARRLSTIERSAER